MKTFMMYLAEMGKKSKTYSTQAAKDDEKLVIKGSDIKVSSGHPQLGFSTGAHKDKRTKRLRTRGDQKRQWKKEQSD